MGRYSLWIDPWKDVKKYENEFRLLKGKEEQRNWLKKNRPCHRLSFIVDGQVLPRLSLEEVDSITAGWKDEAEFMMSLAKNYLVTKDSHLIMTYIEKGKATQEPLIYNHPLLLSYAYKEMNRIQEKKIKAPLEDSEELEELAGQLLEIARDKERRNYITQGQNNKIVMELLPSERRKLKKYLKKYTTVQSTSGYYHPYMLRDALESYIRIYDIYEKNKKLNESRINDSIEIEEAEKEVYQTLRRDYRTLRNSILFLETVKEIEKRKERARMSSSYAYFTSYLESFPMSDDIKEGMRNYLIDEEENKEQLQEIANEEKRKREKMYQEEEEENLDPTVYRDGFSFEEIEHTKKRIR